MFQADATIAYIDRDGMAQAKDYYLSNYVQVCTKYYCTMFTYIWLWGTVSSMVLHVVS